MRGEARLCLHYVAGWKEAGPRRGIIKVTKAVSKVSKIARFWKSVFASDRIRWLPAAYQNTP